MTKIFFYGLFMDRSLLTEKGLHPEIIGPAVLPDYRIHIGERATLLRSASSRGMSSRGSESSGCSSRVLGHDAAKTVTTSRPILGESRTAS